MSKKKSTAVSADKKKSTAAPAAPDKKNSTEGKPAEKKKLSQADIENMHHDSVEAAWKAHCAEKKRKFIYHRS